MRKEVVGKVIKPPTRAITSGRIFRPSKAFLYKMWVKNTAIAFSVWFIIIASFLSISYMIAATDHSEIPNYAQFLGTWFGPVNSWTVLMNLLWLVPSYFITPIYISSIEYSVKGETGETMPEIYVKKGFVTVTRKHVPFRTITNISSKAGPFERFFSIGSVNIETAGFSGSNQTGPEEKLEGITFYEEVRDYILEELRRYRTPYVTGTEMIHREETPVPRGPGLDDEILITLREIRDLLVKK
jgi:membrane protein YdbS with pleckstrin-like domain